MGKAKPPEISIDHLKYLLFKPVPNVITNFILGHKISFQKILQMDLKSGGLITVLKIILHVSNSEFESSASEIIQMTFTNTFIGSMRNFLSNFESSQFMNKGKEDLILIVTFLDVVVNELPLLSPYYALYISLLEQVLETIHKARYGNLPMRSWTEDLILLLKNKNLHLNRQNSLYSDLNVYPSPVDFFEERTLQPNIINRRYTNAEEYLDLQYKLLKEDYIKSVRDGIKQYKRECRGAHKAINPAISVYEDVTVHAIETNNNPRDGILHVILFSTEDEKRLKDEKCDNRRFMNSQLLYLSSCSQFTTFIIATVVDGNFIAIDEKKNERKAIRISVIGDPLQLQAKSQYVLIEPKTFFEPYYQVLKTLKFIKPSEFPMEKYIFNLDLKPCFPKYLLPQYKNNFLNNFDFNILPLVNLNKSQSSALKTALTNEFAIIQGPPGTGKTHLVKSIINVLIKFKGCRSTPIFIVCSRNNSLDLVMGPLAESGHKVIRLGAQTKSDILKDCTIPKLKTKSQNKWCTFNAIKTLKNELLEKGENVDYFSVLFELKKEISAFTKLCDNEDADVISSSGIDVIGATTTGAARLHYLMSLIKPEIVIIEEAAEVFESHVVSSLPQGCKHVILIGDHKQLQPSPAHLSSVKNNMHISLFERLVENGMHFCTLTEQHRMRPEIASLICPLIYETLINHESVCYYPPVKGVSQNVFFIDHVFPEEEITETGSHWNKHEAHFLLALGDYLVKQGYSAKEITILSLYSGQVSFMIEAVSTNNNYKAVKDMKISSVDNYQGEENIIILLSLVRSQTRSIGFLESPNRVNVALSRAKHGLFIIGNMSSLSSHSPLWQNLKKMFEQRQTIDKYLPLQCHTHGNITKVKTKEDITKLKHGGCTNPCNQQLKCGHLCYLICHPSFEQHNCQMCGQSCQRIICELHQTKCNKKMNEDCGKCTEIVLEKQECGHNLKIKCNERKNIKFEKCEKLVSKMLLCGHYSQVPCYLYGMNLKKICRNPCCRIICNLHQTRCNLKCFETCGKCTQIVIEKQKCGHEMKMKCHERHNSIANKCERDVQITLSCGHIIQVPCNLKGLASNQVCKNTCNKIICFLHNTKCNLRCYEKCMECPVLITRKMQCGHELKLPCYQRNNNIPCEGKILRKLDCGHRRSVPCSSPIKKIRCHQPCNRLCAMGHKCLKVCSDPCGPCMAPMKKYFLCCSVTVACSEI